MGIYVEREQAYAIVLLDSLDYGGRIMDSDKHSSKQGRVSCSRLATVPLSRSVPKGAAHECTSKESTILTVARTAPNQREAQRRKARALSSAQNRALSETTQTSKPKLANSSTSTDSSVPDQLVAVA